MAVKRHSASTFGARLTSIISVTLTLLVLGVIAQCALAVHNATQAVRAGTSLYVSLVPGADNMAVNRVKRLIAKQPEVQSNTYTSAEQVLAQEVKLIGKETAALLDQNPYCGEFELHLKPDAANAKSIAALTKRLKADKAVDAVTGDVAVVESINRTFGRIVLTLGIVAAALLAISFVLIGNTVSLSIYSRRFLINTMQLVGATPGFIRRPYLRAGLLNGLLAGLAAAALLAGCQFGAIEADPNLAPLLPWPETAAMLGVLVVLSCVICGASAWLSANAYIRRNYDTLFR